MATSSYSSNNCTGGYEYQFVTKPADWLMCSICQYPSREPYLSGCCGHTFCKSCLDGAKIPTAITKACPTCRDEEFATIPHKQADRAVRNLHILCVNKQRGCEWQGEMNDITNHLRNSDGCQFEEVTCSYDCGISLQRQHLNTHVKMECLCFKVDCQYCHITGERQFIEGEHKEQCPRFPIACPNKCEVNSVPRDDLKEHMKMCPLELIQCEYHLVGCEEKIAREYQKKHKKEKVEEHLSFTIHKLTSTQITIDEFTQQTAKGFETQEQKLASQLTKYQDDLVTKLKQVEKDLKEQLRIAKDDHTQKLQRTEKDLTKAKQELAVTKEKLEVLQEESKKDAMKLSTTSKELADTKVALKATQEATKKAKVDHSHQLAIIKQDIKKTTDELTQKLTNVERNLYSTKQELTTTHQSLVTSERKYTKLAGNMDEALAKLETKFQTKITEIEIAAQKRIFELETKMLENSKLMHNDWLTILSTNASKLLSGDQVVPVIVKVPKFTEKRDKGVKWFSDSFYTHHKGYKMCLKVYANHGWTGTYLYMELFLTKGPYDDALKWPLKGHCEVKLLNQYTNCYDHFLWPGKFNSEGCKRVIDGERSSHPMWSSATQHTKLPSNVGHYLYLLSDSIFIRIGFRF